MPDGTSNTLQKLFSDNDFISLSPAARRDTLRQIVPELRTATDQTIDQFATAYGGPSYQQMTDPNATPRNFQSKPGGPVTNAYGITGPLAPRPGENFEDVFRRLAQNATAPGEVRNAAGNKVIVPAEGETFGATMDRAIQYGRTVTPQQIQKETQLNKKLAPAALAAGPALAAAQFAIPTAVSMATAPTAVGATEGTGILDAAGNEIVREVTKAGPALGKLALRSTLSWIGRHPYVAAAAYEGARRAGIPLPNVIGWLAKAAGEAR